MLRFAAIAAALLVSGASADTLAFKDGSGAEKVIDTANLTGCRIIFDSAGAPFEICRMKKVELEPPASTRARPGHPEKPDEGRGDVVYVRAD